MEARATEAANQAEKFAQKLGIKLPGYQRIFADHEDANNRSPQTGSSRTDTDKSSLETLNTDDAIWLSQNHSDTSRNPLEEEFICRTIKPSQMNRFWGDEEEVLYSL
ncbi:hypothetical protein RB195_019675 [Necator americanus]|uniref:Uncharacterized protein n=1 Tax=Necator americanus TaxID=51031 RepID=A0ABR1CHH9_NECAM